MEEAKRHPKARARRGRLHPHPCALRRVSGTAQGPLGWGDKGRAGRPSYLAIPSRAPAQPQGRATTRALQLRRVPTPHKSMVRGAGELAPPRENLGNRRGRRGGRSWVPLPFLCPNSRLSPPHSRARTHAHFPRPCPAAARGFRPLRAVQGHAGLRGTAGGCSSAAAAAAALGLRAAGRPAAILLPPPLRPSPQLGCSREPWISRADLRGVGVMAGPTGGGAWSRGCQQPAAPPAPAECSCGSTASGAPESRSPLSRRGIPGARLFQSPGAVEAERGRKE